MALPIHTYFDFLLSDASYDEYLNYMEPERIQSFQGPDSAVHYNGINFVTFEAEDFETNGAAATDYSFAFVAWDGKKLRTPSPMTLLETDPTRGNRLAGMPLMQERKGAITDCTTQVAHSLLSDIKYVSYSSGSNAVTVNTISPLDANDIPIGAKVVLARSVPDDTTFTGSALVEYKIVSQVDEWEGIVASFDGIKLVVNLITVPADTGILSDIRLMAPSNQKLWLIPLGHVRSGIDDNESLPSNTSWTYEDVSINAIGPYRSITPKIETNYPTIGDRFKYFILIERDSGNQPFESGFKVLPILISY